MTKTNPNRKGDLIEVRTMSRKEFEKFFPESAYRPQPKKEDNAKTT